MQLPSKTWKVTITASTSENKYLVGFIPERIYTKQHYLKVVTFSDPSFSKNRIYVYDHAAQITPAFKIEILLVPVNWSLRCRSGRSKYLLQRSQDYRSKTARWLQQRFIYRRPLKSHQSRQLENKTSQKVTHAY